MVSVGCLPTDEVIVCVSIVVGNDMSCVAFDVITYDSTVVMSVCDFDCIVSAP